MEHTLTTIRQLKLRYQDVQVQDKSRGYNTELLQCIEVGFGLDIAEATCLAALVRRESRGAHQRLDEGCTARNDVDYLQHSLVYFHTDNDTTLTWQPVDTSILPPAVRAYGDGATGGKL